MFKVGAEISSPGDASGPVSVKGSNQKLSPPHPHQLSGCCISLIKAIICSSLLWYDAAPPLFTQVISWAPGGLGRAPVRMLYSSLPEAEQRLLCHSQDFACKTTDLLGRGLEACGLLHSSCCRLSEVCNKATRPIREIVVAPHLTNMMASIRSLLWLYRQSLSCDRSFCNRLKLQQCTGGTEAWFLRVCDQNSDSWKTAHTWDYGGASAPPPAHLPPLLPLWPLCKGPPWVAEWCWV